jgi:nucleoside-diphosphate-sugar epimerase
MNEPLAPMFIDDFAHGLVELGEHEAALGKAWHLPTPDPTTARVFIEMLFAQVQRPVKVARLGTWSARVLGLGWPVLREGAEMLYQFRQPHSVDASRYRRVFGPGRVTAYEEGIRQTLNWYRNANSRPLATVGQ